MFEKLYGILQQRAYIPTLLFCGKKNWPVVQDFGNTAFDCSGKGTKAGVPLRSLGQIRVSDGGSDQDTFLFMKQIRFSLNGNPPAAGFRL